MEELLEFFESVLAYNNEKHAKIEQESNEKDRQISDLEDKIISIRENPKGIADYSDDDILDIVNKINMDDELLDESEIEITNNLISSDGLSPRKKIFYILLQAKTICLFDEDDEIGLTDEQVDTIGEIVRKLKNDIESLKNEKATSREEVIEVAEFVEDLQVLLAKLNKEMSSDVIITDYDTIDKSLDESDKTEEEKIRILKELLLFNQTQYSEKMLETIPRLRRVREIKSMSEEELKESLEPFSFTLDDFIFRGNRTYLDLLLKYGNKDNIYSLLELLTIKYRLSKDKFSLDKKLVFVKNLVSILLRSDVDTIEQKLNILKDYGYQIIDLIHIPEFIIKETKSNEIDNGAETDDGYLLTCGRANTFDKNLEFFTENNFDLNSLFKSKGLTAFGNPYKTVKYNFEIFKLYNFDALKRTPIKLDAPTALGASYASELMDKFIEIGFEAFVYLRQYSSSRLLTSDPNHKVLYELYRDYRSNKPDFKVSDYLAPLQNRKSSETQEYKNEIAGTIIPSIPNREVMEDIVREKLSERKNKALNGNLNQEEGNVLYDYDVLNIPVVKKIDEKYGNSENLLVLNFNGIIISRNKFLKVFNVLKNVNDIDLKDRILYSLTYGSIINEHDYLIIKTEINELMNKRELR